jgi:hypothetical protein
LATDFASEDLRTVLEEWKRFPSFLGDSEPDDAPFDIPDLLDRTSSAVDVFVSDVSRSVPPASDQIDGPAFALQVAFGRLVAAFRDFQARFEQEEDEKKGFAADVIAPTAVDFPEVPTPRTITPPDIRPPQVDQARLARLRGS